jgi:putative membrane protein
MIDSALFFAINTIILMILSAFLKNFNVDSIFASLIFLLVLTFLNWTIVPILKFLSLPINLLLFGLVGFFINLMALWIAVEIVPGIDITASGLEYFLNLLVISICLSVISPSLKRMLESFNF